MTKDQRYQYKSMKKRITRRIKNHRYVELQKLKQFKKNLKEENKNAI